MYIKGKKQPTRKKKNKKGKTKKEKKKKGTTNINLVCVCVGSIFQNLCFFVLAYSGSCKDLSACRRTNKRDSEGRGATLCILQPFLFYPRIYVLESVIILSPQKLIIAGSNKSFRHSLSHSLSKSHCVSCILGPLWMRITLKIQQIKKTNQSHRRLSYDNCSAKRVHGNEQILVWN